MSEKSSLVSARDVQAEVLATPGNGLFRCFARIRAAIDRWLLRRRFARWQAGREFMVSE